MIVNQSDCPHDLVEQRQGNKELNLKRTCCLQPCLKTKGKLIQLVYEPALG